MNNPGRLPRSRRKERLRQRFAIFLSEFQRVPWSDEVSAVFGQVKALMERCGVRLEDFDVAVVAHAAAIEATLVTDDLEHMSRIPGWRAGRRRRCVGLDPHFSTSALRVRMEDAARDLQASFRGPGATVALFPERAIILRSAGTGSPTTARLVESLGTGARTRADSRNGPGLATGWDESLEVRFLPSSPQNETPYR